MYYPNIQRETLDKERNLAIEGFGHRLYDSQTVYEYLLEFLLVFISPKGWGEKHIGSVEPFKFPDVRSMDEWTDKLYYEPVARIGLKRFVFFERSKQEHRFPIDKWAHAETLHALESNIEESYDLSKRDVLFLLQDLFYGFNAVLKNRAWFAQSLLPITPELTFVEAMGNAKARKQLTKEAGFRETDGAFQFQGHYFLARGGEVYFLHLLRGLLERPDLKERIEQGLVRLIKESFPQFSWLAQWIEQNWLAHAGAEKQITVRKTCEWIPEGYAERAVLSCEEMVNILEAELPELQKIDLLAKGIVMQVLRMMHEQAAKLAGAATPPRWITQVNSKPGTNVRKYSIESYQACEEDFAAALDRLAGQETSLSPKGSPLFGDVRRQALKKSAQHTSRLFRRLSKEIGLVVPPKGAQMRFALNEDLVKFLVTSIIRPGKKMLLSSFLKELNRRYGFVIGPDELSAQVRGLRAGDLDDNQEKFQELLKQCGFLRDLSDATSIVENPFGGMAK